MTNDKDIPILIPPISTTSIDTGEHSVLVLGYSKKEMSRIPPDIREKAYLNVCHSCLGECYTTISYQGQTVHFLCGDCSQ
jgi:hypothetical protein